MKHVGGKHLTWGLKNGLGIPGEGKALFRQQHQDLSVVVEGPISLGWGVVLVGWTCPEVMMGAGCRSRSERRRGLAEAKLRGALTSGYFFCSYVFCLTYPQAP